MKTLKQNIKEAIEKYSEKNTQINLESEAARENLADFIDKYLFDEV